MKRRTILTEQNLFPLLKEGLNHTQIGKKLGIDVSAVSQFCRRRGLSSNFKYTKSFDTEKYLELYNQGLNDSEISRILNTNHRKLRDYRVKQGLPINHKNNYSFTDIDRAFFIGWVLGDGYLRKDNNSYGGMYAHSLKQEDYFYWKYYQQQDKFRKPAYKKHHNKKVDKVYECVYAEMKRHPSIKEIYDVFYLNRKKSVYNKEWVQKYFTELSLAIWFGDDGTRSKTYYNLASMCFDDDTILFLKQLLLTKFNIHSTSDKKNNIYICTKSSRDIFKHIVGKHLPESMQYKVG